MHPKVQYDDIFPREKRQVYLDDQADWKATEASTHFQTKLKVTTKQYITKHSKTESQMCKCTPGDFNETSARVVRRSVFIR